MMIKTLTIAGVAAASLLLSATAANAVTYSATFSGAAENPPNASTATGFGTLRIIGDSIFVNITYSGITSGLRDAHIHCCNFPTGNAGVAVGFPLLPSGSPGPGFVLGSTSGSFTRLIDLTVASNFNTTFRNNNGGTAASARQALFDGLADGRAYFNLHSEAFRPGEIRGNLSVVPEPASWAMLVIGFGFVGSAVRRRNAAFA